MNREILFRGFHEDKSGKETIYIDGREIKGFWVYGDLVKCMTENGECIGIKDTIYEVNTNRCNLIPNIVIPSTVGQYTGLTANGKKIFEGDIVNFKTTAYHFKNCRIKYQSYYARYCAIDNKGYEYPMDKIFEYEVIGNIFSNPELLKGECK